MRHQASIILAGSIIGSALGPCPLVAQTAAPRAERPDWSARDTSDIFFADAFREAFDGKSPFVDVVERTNQPPTLDGGSAEAAVESTPRWSSALDVQLLIAEIKAVATRSQNRTRSARSFADDARDETRRDFVVAATLFRILDAWDGDVRFKPQAASASDWLSQAAQAIANPSGDVFERAKRTSADLIDIVRGNQPLPADGQAPSWKQLVQRDDFMWQLELAVEQAIADGLESEKTLRANQEELARAANLAAALLMALSQPMAIDAQRADYVEFARNASREATNLRTAIVELDVPRSQAALRNLRQSCEACHEEYQ